MASFIRCDGGCGKESPDAGGRHVANSWMGVQTLKPSDRNHVGVRWEQRPSESYIFCDDCWPRVAEALPQRPTPPPPPEPPRFR